VPANAGRPPRGDSDASGPAWLHSSLSVMRLLFLIRLSLSAFLLVFPACRQSHSVETKNFLKHEEELSRVSVKALFALWVGGPVVLWSVVL
jgi:hypothetical protein